MKGPIEVYPILVFGMAFVILGFSMVEITLNYNNARVYQESIVSTIEKHNRYDADIGNLIERSEFKCNKCTYRITKVDSKFMVYVDFEVSIPIIKFTKTTSIKSLTQSIV